MLGPEKRMMNDGPIKLEKGICWEQGKVERSIFVYSTVFAVQLYRN